MDFSLSEEQRMLVDSLTRFVEREYDFESRRAIAASEAGFSQKNWRTLADMGLLGLIVPEDFGGMGGNAADTLVAMEQLGRALVLEPIVPSAIIGASLLAELGSQAQKSTILPALVEGNTRLAIAALEPDARFDLEQVNTRAKRAQDGFVLDGGKAVVAYAASANLLLVSARSSGEPRDRAGISLFLVPADAAGLRMEDFPTIDGARAAEIHLEGVRLDADALVGPEGQAYLALEQAVDRGIAALCAEAVGAMSKLNELTADYLRTRQQFGKAIGSFQSLQHRYADMLIALEQARSLSYCAAAGVDQADPVQRRRAVSAAKVRVGQSGRYIAQQAIQLHGGMGMTDELSVGHYAKRLNSIDMSWGNAEHHIEMYVN